MTSKRVIHLGCGQAFDPAYHNNINFDYITNDISALPGVKWCYDLNNVPWPYDDESTQTVLAIDVIEHLDNPKSILEEIYRILIPGGLLQLQVPYFGSLAHANDMTHKHGFTPSTFGFFIPGHPYCESSPWYSSARFTVSSLMIDNVPLSSFSLAQELKHQILFHHVVGNIQMTLIKQI